MSQPSLPLPPLDLMRRIALRPAPVADMQAEFIEGGRLRRDTICATLPEGWSFAGKSVLDFGCGPGRVLRHFHPEATECTFLGCDIDAESVEWLTGALAPPFKLFVSGEAPPLPLESNSLDLIYATSVFTHLTDLWGEWLVELRRLLKDDGLLFMTFLGCDAFAGRYIRQPWSEDEIGLTMLGIVPPEEGGAIVLMSEWWTRTHLARGFDIVDIKADGWGALPDRAGRGQGMLLLRRKAGPLSVEELLAPEPDDPREWASVQLNLRLLRHEILDLRGKQRQSPVKPPSSHPSQRQRLAKLVRRK
jgi:SAM-dependent methyltransferase